MHFNGPGNELLQGIISHRNSDIGRSVKQQQGIISYRNSNIGRSVKQQGIISHRNSNIGRSVKQQQGIISHRNSDIGRSVKQQQGIILGREPVKESSKARSQLSIWQVCTYHVVKKYHIDNVSYCSIL